MSIRPQIRLGTVLSAFALLAAGAAMAAFGAQDASGGDAPATPSSASQATPVTGGSALKGPRPRLGWELDITPGPMRLFVDPADGRPYWYFTYKAENNSGRDLRFAPKLELVDEEGRITVSGHGVPSDVTRKLMTLLNNPLLEDQNQILGDILQGEQHAREGIVVFPAQHIESNELFLYVSGISSERQRVTDVNGGPVILRRQFRVAYQVPGNATARGSEPLPLLDEGKEPNPRWILR